VHDETTYARMCALRAVTHYVRIRENMIRGSRKTISRYNIFTDSDLVRNRPETIYVARRVALDVIFSSYKAMPSQRS
jgi:hypothetical protein